MNFSKGSALQGGWHDLTLLAEIPHNVGSGLDLATWSLHFDCSLVGSLICLCVFLFMTVGGGGTDHTLCLLICCMHSHYKYLWKCDADFLQLLLLILMEIHFPLEALQDFFIPFPSSRLNMHNVEHLRATITSAQTHKHPSFVVSMHCKHW